MDCLIYLEKRFVSKTFVLLYTFINDLLDNSFTRGLLIECCAVNNTFCSIRCWKWLTFWQSVGPCQLWCVSNHGFNSRSLTVTPCKTFTFSINYQRIWVREKIYSVTPTTWSTARISLTSYVEWIHSIDCEKEGNNLLNFIHKVLCNISGFLNGSLMINNQSFKVA